MRPDCLPEEVISLLAEMNRIKPVWVELGLQTIHENYDVCSSMFSEKRFTSLSTLDALISSCSLFSVPF